MAEASGWIAIVDDDRSVLKAVTRLLRAGDFEAKPYESAQEFLAALPDGLPKCPIADLQMPDMSGLELLQHLTHWGIRLPTIIVTAHGEPGVRERCTSAGAAGFLLKPLHGQSLFAAIADAGGPPAL